MQLTTRHKEFCKLVAEGLKAAPAYQKAYKKKDSIVCRVAACNLLKKPEIKAEIERVQKLAAKIAEKAEQKAMEAIAEKVGAEIADKAERMAHLTRIMRGQERVRSDKFFFDSKTGAVVVQEVYELPDAQAQIKAISELNKMDGSYEPAKVDVTSNGKSMPSWANGE